MSSNMRNKVVPLKLWISAIAMVAVAECLPVKAQVINEKPFVGIAFEDRTAKITFTGTLLSSDSVNGPWQTITNADTPYSVDMAVARKFYRAGSYGTNSI